MSIFFESAHICKDLQKFCRSSHIYKDLQKSCRSAQIRKDRKTGYRAIYFPRTVPSIPVIIPPPVITTQPSSPISPQTYNTYSTSLLSTNFTNTALTSNTIKFNLPELFLQNHQQFSVTPIQHNLKHFLFFICHLSLDFTILLFLQILQVTTIPNIFNYSTHVFSISISKFPSHIHFLQIPILLFLIHILCNDILYEYKKTPSVPFAALLAQILLMA